jgi:hypothetical protein
LRFTRLHDLHLLLPLAGWVALAGVVAASTPAPGGLEAVGGGLRVRVSRFGFGASMAGEPSRREVGGGRTGGE